ncbi:trimethylamine methyltransferase family protein [Acetobacterium malicum]|uniref:trimethylamine methyltransferase family protein n=1 Tax=Acetobacterium malicum TaxID=52692 RepID=UPI0003FCD83B|nr:trimethylamine methyltransferase family protein [Acetobacterium dehalogenans]
MYPNRKIYEKYLSQEDVELIHDCSLRILSEVGIIIESDYAIDLFKKNGAQTDGQKVFISEKMLNDALKTVPKSFQIYSPKGILSIGEDSPTICAGPVAPTTIQDFANNTYRPATLRDVEDYYILQETSTAVDMVTHSCQNTDDLDKSVADFHTPQVAMGLKYCQKPIYQANTITPSNNKKMSMLQANKNLVKLHQEFYDVWDTPVMLSNCCVLSPLAIGSEVVDTIIGAVELGQPVIIIACSMTNLTSPPSLAGTIAQDNANILAGIVLAQMIKPGVGVVYGSVTSGTDMRNVQLATGGPEAVLMQLGLLAMGRYYNVPVRGGVAATNAIDLDYQCGAESLMTLIPGLLGKTDFILNSAGSYGAYNLGSIEKFVLDEEIIHYLKRINQGLSITDKKLNFDLINKTGPRGAYLTGRTPKDYREEHYLSKTFVREGGSAESIIEKNGNLIDRARKQADERIANYKLPDVTSSQKKILNAYLPEKFKYQL